MEVFMRPQRQAVLRVQRSNANSATRLSLPCEGMNLQREWAHRVRHTLSPAAKLADSPSLAPTSAQLALLHSVIAHAPRCGPMRPRGRN